VSVAALLARGGPVNHPSPPLPSPIATSLLTLLPSQVALQLTNACPATSSPEACAKTFYGVLAKGLVPALQSLDNLIKELLNKACNQPWDPATGLAVQVRYVCCCCLQVEVASTQAECHP
jgi:hypothetical protein